jgi:hypothetical protein
LNKSRLVIGTSRTVGSAKKYVRITSGFGGGEFTKTLRKVCTCQKLKFAFLLLEYCKIRECYAVANAFMIRNMYSLLLYMNCNSRKINRPTKNMTKIVSIYQFCRKQLTKLANLLMHSQCALSEPISSSRKTRKLTVCRFI